MNSEEMQESIATIVAPGKGVLAADESTGTIGKRFDTIGVENTEPNRRAYRELLFTSETIGEHIGGVILYDETLRQSTQDGTGFAEVLRRQGVVPGIKVDKGAKELAGFPGEKVTEGLDGLRERLAEYYELGARFAKWRAVIDIGEGLPSWNCVRSNAHALARYAALCLEADIVPIVEPEVLMDGDHTIGRCYEVTHWTLRTVFEELDDAGIPFDHMLLKPNMVIPGKKCEEQSSPEEVAEATLHCFAEVVPSAVPGVVFLSGGQTEVEATANLNAMNAGGPHPWELSFSYGRALQQSALQAWRGITENVPSAQAAFLHRARMNGFARTGDWSEGREVA